MELASPQFLHNPKASVSTVGYGDDKAIHATFDDLFVKNEYKSEMDGVARFEHYYVVELQYPGDNTKTFKWKFPITEKTNQWIERFPRQWEAFKNSKEQSPDGTPIEVWPPLDKARVFELKAAKIFTVEQIASMSDTTGPALGLDWRKLRDQAKAFLNPDIGTAQLSRLMRETEDKDRRIAAMEQKLAALTGVEPTENVHNIVTEKKRRGRKLNPQPTEAT